MFAVATPLAVNCKIMASVPPDNVCPTVSCIGIFFDSATCFRQSTKIGLLSALCISPTPFPKQKVGSSY